MWNSGKLDGARRARLAYKGRHRGADYLRRRAEKIVRTGWNGTSYATLQSDTRFIYHGWNLVAELTDSGLTFVLGRTYTWGVDLSGTLAGDGGTGGLLMTQDGTNQYVYAYDGNGNVSAVMNRADGTTVAEYEYGAFGEPLRATGTYAQTNPYRFSTQYVDDETGLSYYGHRYYSPDTGRFVGRDPTGESGGPNLYAFCANGPVSRFDRLGDGYISGAFYSSDVPTSQQRIIDAIISGQNLGLGATPFMVMQAENENIASNLAQATHDQDVSNLMSQQQAASTAATEASLANALDPAGKMSQLADNTLTSFASAAVDSSGAGVIASSGTLMTNDANAVAVSADKTWSDLAQATDANVTAGFATMNANLASTAPATPPPPQTSGNGAGAQASGPAAVSSNGTTAPVDNNAPPSSAPEIGGSNSEAFSNLRKVPVVEEQTVLGWTGDDSIYHIIKDGKKAIGGEIILSSRTVKWAYLSPDDHYAGGEILKQTTTKSYAHDDGVEFVNNEGEGISTGINEGWVRYENGHQYFPTPELNDEQMLTLLEVNGLDISYIQYVALINRVVVINYKGPNG